MKKVKEFLKKIIGNNKINWNSNGFNSYKQVELKPAYVARKVRSFDDK
ncbi:MAG: hypothetical protein ACERKZ_18495 [Lachnotalea sp.]